MAALLLLAPLWPTLSAAEPSHDPDTDDPPVVETAPKDDAAAKPYWEAIKLFRQGKESDWKRARELLEESAADEFTHAQNLLGSMLLRGEYGYSKSTRKAASYFELAAARGNAFAALNIGLCYHEGTGVRKDPDVALSWLRKAIGEKANFDSPTPPTGLLKITESAPDSDTVSGEVHVDPADTARATAHYVIAEILTLKKDLASAQEHYVKAATAGPAGRAGILPAAHKAATGFAFGRGVPRDPARANEMLAQSKKLTRRMGMVYAHALVQNKALDDFAQADVEEEFSAVVDKMERNTQFEIAGTFADPKSKDYDPIEAAKWYELAADNGSPWAMLALAFLHTEGKLGAPDPAKAFHYFKSAAPKHLLGSANVGICYANGIGVAKDEAAAAREFAENCKSDFVCYLGTIGQAPTTPVNYEQALELNKAWAKKKDPRAMYLLGLRYMKGWGVEENAVEGHSWYLRAAKANDVLAQLEVAQFYELNGDAINLGRTERMERALEWYIKAADAGNVEACTSLAYCHAEGKGVPRDLQKAVALYERAIALDPSASRALNNLGAYYSDLFEEAVKAKDSQRAELNKRKMLEYYEAAQKHGSAHAAQNLGLLYYNGDLGKPDFEKAYGYFQTAAEGGKPVARRMLGKMHERGESVPVTYREAAYHYRLAALADDKPALEALCDFYLAGKGVSRDFDRAAYWLLMLAQKGDARAVVLLGDLALRQKDYANALKLFRQLSYINQPVIQGYAFERMSWLYQRGWGVTANPKRAARYHQKAVDLGDSEALYVSALDLYRAGRKAEARPMLEKAAPGVPAAKYTLGYMYLAGDSGPQDMTKGWALIREAAEGGHRDAQFTMAAAALKRLPGAPDMDEAVRFAEAAEASGHPGAKALREQLEKTRK